MITRLHPVGPAAIDPPRRPRPVGAVRASLGFPSPADDFSDESIDLNQWLIRNEPATFFYRAAGDSMRDLGILDGDLLAVDRSVTPVDGDVVLAIWDGNNPACKVLRVFADHVQLHSAQPGSAPIVLPPGTEVEVFAVVGVVRQMTRGRCVRAAGR